MAASLWSWCVDCLGGVPLRVPIPALGMGPVLRPPPLTAWWRFDAPGAGCKPHGPSPKVPLPEVIYTLWCCCSTFLVALVILPLWRPTVVQCFGFSLLLGRCYILIYRTCGVDNQPVAVQRDGAQQQHFMPTFLGPFRLLSSPSSTVVAVVVGAGFGFAFLAPVRPWMLALPDLGTCTSRFPNPCASSVGFSMECEVCADAWRPGHCAEGHRVVLLASPDEANHAVPAQCRGLRPASLKQGGLGWGWLRRVKAAKP